MLMYCDFWPKRNPKLNNNPDYCLQLLPLQAGIEFKKNLRERFGNYGGLKLEYFWVVKSKKAKSFIRG